MIDWITLARKGEIVPVGHLLIGVVVKEGAAGERRIVLDLKVAPDLAVLGDGRLGLETARPEVVRVLAGRLNARVRLVDYQRYPSHRRLGIRSPHAAGAYAFRASSGQEVGDQWVAARPVADGLPILRGGSLGLLLQPEATGDDAAELAADRNASVAALTYWGCPVVSFPVPNAG